MRLNFKRASNLFVNLHFLLQVKGITSVCSKYFVTFRRSRCLNSAVWRLEGVNSTIFEPSLFSNRHQLELPRGMKKYRGPPFHTSTTQQFKSFKIEVALKFKIIEMTPPIVDPIVFESLQYFLGC